MEVFFSVAPSDRILFLGEGNFTFSTSLVCRWNESFASLPHVVSTCFEDQPVSVLATENIERLKKMGVRVGFSVDATKDFSPGELFTRVFFMFPHVGGKSKINLNRDLMKRFAENIASKLYNQYSRVVVTLCAGQGGTEFDPVQRVAGASIFNPKTNLHYKVALKIFFWGTNKPQGSSEILSITMKFESKNNNVGDTWQIIPMMSFGKLQMVDICPFDAKEFDEYKSFGYRGLNKGFHSESGIVHVFEPSPLSSSYFRVFDSTSSVEDLADLYIRQKVQKFKEREVLVGKKFLEMCKEIFTLVPSAEICFENYEKNFSIEKLLVENDITNSLKNSNSKTYLKVIFTANFKLDFSKCPLQIHLLLGPVPVDHSLKLLQFIGQDVSEIIHLDSCSVGILCDVQAWTMRSGHLESWQELWAEKKLLYPSTFTHDLAFTFTDDRVEFEEKDLATILWTMGFDSVTSFNIFDRYVDQNGIVSNTCRLSYKSFLYPSSSAFTWEIHYNRIGAKLSEILKVQLR